MNASAILTYAKLYAERTKLYDAPIIVSSYLLDDEHSIFDKFCINFAVNSVSKEQIFLITDSVHTSKHVVTLRDFIDILDYGIKEYGDLEICLSSKYFNESLTSDLDSGGFYICYYRSGDYPDVTIQAVLLADVKHDEIIQLLDNKKNKFKIIM